MVVFSWIGSESLQSYKKSFLPYLLSAMWRYNEKVSVYKQEKSSHQNSCWHLDLRLWGSQFSSVQLLRYIGLIMTPSEKAVAPHSRTLAWKIPWMEEPGRLQSMESLRVGYDWAIHFHFSFSCIGKGNGNPLQYSCLENPRDGGTWWAAIYGVAQSRTRLRQLSSSSSRERIWFKE